MHAKGLSFLLDVPLHISVSAVLFAVVVRANLNLSPMGDIGSVRRTNLDLSHLGDIGSVRRTDGRKHMGAIEEILRQL
jgi:hypothetical protein